MRSGDRAQRLRAVTVGDCVSCRAVAWRTCRAGVRINSRCRCNCLVCVNSGIGVNSLNGGRSLCIDGGIRRNDLCDYPHRARVANNRGVSLVRGRRSCIRVQRRGKWSRRHARVRCTRIHRCCWYNLHIVDGLTAGCCTFSRVVGSTHNKRPVTGKVCSNTRLCRIDSSERWLVVPVSNIHSSGHRAVHRDRARCHGRRHISASRRRAAKEASRRNGAS